MSQDNSKQDNLNFREEDDMDVGEANAKDHFSTSRKKNIPIKSQVRQLEKDIAELKNTWNEGNKNRMLWKGELSALDAKIKEKMNELHKTLIDDLANFKKDLKRIIQNDKNESAFFTSQAAMLNEDKIKLQKETIALTSRMTTCESDVGVSSKY